jgi:hypothetical protein
MYDANAPGAAARTRAASGGPAVAGAASQRPGVGAAVTVADAVLSGRPPPALGDGAASPEQTAR